MHYTVSRKKSYYQIAFCAMASDCELLICETDEAELHRIARLALAEVYRIENKYSRFRADSIITKINRSAGQQVVIDAETSKLISFANHCFQLSNGKFDITSGVLSQLWKIGEQKQAPDTQSIADCMQRTGWEKVDFSTDYVQLPQGMSLDFGGFGKEYAVDQLARILVAESSAGFVVNLGGDIAMRRRADGEAWQVAIEGQSASFSRYDGCYATSGTTRRFSTINGENYGHIIDPQTGWPVRNPPRSVTVGADSCLAAGLLSTLAMLHGEDAEVFLDKQQTEYWCYR